MTDTLKSPLAHVEFLSLSSDQQAAVEQHMQLREQILEGIYRETGVSGVLTEAVNVGMPRKPDGEGANCGGFTPGTHEEQGTAPSWRQEAVDRLDAMAGVLTPEQCGIVAFDEVYIAPYALTDQHVTALTRAIEAEGYRVLVDPETGDVKLERA